MKKLALALFFVASSAHAEDDATSLVKTIDDSSKTLSTLSSDDCLSACKALSSMTRAAERLCEIEPGPRCQDAKRTVSDATKRVREACPMCVVASQPKEREPELVVESTAQTAAVRPTGGCAGCSASGSTTSGSLALGLASLLALAALRRRRIAS